MAEEQDPSAITTPASHLAADYGGGGGVGAVGGAGGPKLGSAAAGTGEGLAGLTGGKTGGLKDIMGGGTGGLSDIRGGQVGGVSDILDRGQGEGGLPGSSSGLTHPPAAAAAMRDIGPDPRGAQ